MPLQKHPPDAADPKTFFVNFADRDAANYVVRDIQTGARLGWTFDHPEMKFPIETRPGLRFFMHFWIHSGTLHDTGPVTFSVKVNGRPLQSMRCEHDGRYLFDQAVPLESRHPGQLLHVVAEATPLWTSPDSGAHLGYLIEDAGFRW